MNQESKKTVVNSWNEWDPLKHVIVGRADGTNKKQKRGQQKRGQVFILHLTPFQFPGLFFSEFCLSSYLS